jgi:hypothetical protein
VRARTEAVILMKLWVGGQTELFFESRYRQARDQGLALQDAMLAAEARWKLFAPPPAPVKQRCPASSPFLTTCSVAWP